MRRLQLWWGALVRPDRGGALVLDGQPGLELFLLALVALLYGVYGAAMGLFRCGWDEGWLMAWLPTAISALKLPFLYLFSLAVCFYPLYVLNLMFGPRLRPAQCLRLLLLAISANAAAIASYAPFSAFFALTTSRQGYSFLVLMHVAVLGLAALASLVVIGLIFRATGEAAGRRARPSFMVVWALLYAFVGTQMSWVLRPWIGSWTGPYAMLRPRGGSFIEAVWHLLGRVF